MDGNLLVTADSERPEDAINQLASFRKVENKQTATFSFLAIVILKKFISFPPLYSPCENKQRKKIQLEKNRKKHSKTTPSKVYGIAIPDGVASF
jgi:hypothetical protein